MKKVHSCMIIVVAVLRVVSLLKHAPNVNYGMLDCSGLPVFVRVQIIRLCSVA
jgi:hypothetical protein